MSQFKSFGPKGGNGSKTFGMPKTFGNEVRPRAGLGMTVDSPKMPKLDNGIHYTAAQVAGPKAKGSTQKHGMTMMPHKVNY